MPASQALLIVGLSAESERGVDEDRVRLLADDVVERVDLRLDGALRDFDVEVDATRERPFFTETWATRCICWRQSFPTKLLLR